MPLVIFKFKKIKSTNDRAIQNIKRGIQKGIIVSDQQTSGRGTYGKKWVSFKGNLFVSFFFEIKKKINLKRITLINFNIIIITFLVINIKTERGINSKIR